MCPLFTGPKLKIERARQHINDLQVRFTAFSSSDYYSFGVEKDVNSGKRFLKFEVTKPLPSDVAPIIGDALHNLKSALDLAINDVVFLKLGRYDAHTRFPFRETRNELEAAIKGALITQASKTIADLIVNVVKAYKGGNDALWTLHELNILDKHRLLLPVIHVGVLHGVGLEDDRGNQFTGLTMLVEAGRVHIPSIPGHAGDNFKITNKGKPTLSVFFAEGLPTEGQFVLPTLICFVELVSNIIEQFERVV
jgi:hypothetical protein